MKRKLHRDDREGGEEVNPMEDVANLADVMLVLAVGMMLALVVAWNVDIASSNLRPVEPLAPADDDYSQVWASAAI
jgi:hypothetical protein